MTAHAIVIDNTVASDARDAVCTPPRYRWHCSCHRVGGWTFSPRSARTGGQRHVAAMERGRDPFAVLRQPGKGGARTTEGNTREIAKHERRAAIARGVMRRGEARGVGAGKEGDE